MNTITYQVAILGNDQLVIDEIIDQLTQAATYSFYTHDFTNLSGHSLEQAITKKHINFFIIALKKNTSCDNSILSILRNQKLNDKSFIILSNDEQQDIVKSLQSIGFTRFIFHVQLSLLAIEDILLNSDSDHKQHISRRAINAHDSLTGLYDRSVFEKKLKSYFSTAKRYSRVSALLLFNIDDFKVVNNTHGHFIGDWLLKKISKRLLLCTRESDIVARVSGDEFGIILDEIKNESEAGIAAKKIQSNIEKAFHLNAVTISLTVSVAIVCFPADFESSERLIDIAEDILFRVKDTHRGGLQYYSEYHFNQYQRMLSIYQLLPNAIQSHEIELYYQPIIDINRNTLIGFEALSRWLATEDHETISPGEFIPVIEHSSFIHEFGLQTIENAIKALSFWRSHYHFTGFVSINISPLQLLNKDFSKEFFRLLEVYQLPAEHIMLEITENILMGENDNALHLLNLISSLGVRIEIDDFGTGFSSLDRLKQLVINGIKIDRSFTADIGEHNNDLIIKSIMAMAKALKIEVIAEGIENKKQMQFLAGHDCCFIQGFYFYKPMSLAMASQLIAKLKDNNRLLV